MTPYTDAELEDVPNLSPRALATIRRLRRERDEARSELERERVRLAGCSVAALGLAEDVEPGDYGHSASYDDVVRLRKRADAAEQHVKELGGEL